MCLVQHLPIVAPINDLNDTYVNFDGITYAKGASVLKQLVAYVGRERFFDGIHRYPTRHVHPPRSTTCSTSWRPPPAAT
ncbi:MAG: M1 family aminopeptidase [Bifidobacterium pullorum]